MFPWSLLTRARSASANKGRCPVVESGRMISKGSVSLKGSRPSLRVAVSSWAATARVFTTPSFVASPACGRPGDRHVREALSTAQRERRAGYFAAFDYAVADWSRELSPGSTDPFERVSWNAARPEQAAPSWAVLNPWQSQQECSHPVLHRSRLLDRSPSHHQKSDRRSQRLTTRRRRQQRSVRQRSP